ncbi:MAG: HAD family hydrolase [Clostridia bacterium]|nr:HAD family hydrolase [Clostridia bacterium]
MMKAVLFDLDGTLLPMDNDEFVEAYMALLCKKISAYGYDPRALSKAMWTGIQVMFRNDGTRTNDACFWEGFVSVLGTEALKDMDKFELFYEQYFDSLQSSCGCNPLAKETIDYLKGREIKIALATNPVFPVIAVQKRIRWAGLDPNDFQVITTYETERFCKPTEGYYSSIADRLGVSPSECLMVGNDVDDDMPARKIGMDVFLLTDHLINRKNADISSFPHGSFSDLLSYLKGI